MKSSADESARNKMDETEAGEIDAYNKIEIAEIPTRTRELAKMRVQIFSFFGAASLTIPGLVVKIEAAGMIFVSAALMVLLIGVDWSARRQLGVLYCRGLQIERQYCNEPGALIRRHVSVVNGIFSPASTLFQLAELKNQEERIRGLRKYRTSIMGLWFPMGLMTVEVAMGLALWLNEGWGIF